MHELFISYCRHDSDAANALADTLSKAGLSVWLDRKAIQEGAAFDTQIEEAIAQTRVVIVIWSEHSIKSHWVRAEAAYALGNTSCCPSRLINPSRLCSSCRFKRSTSATGIAPATTMHFSNSPVRWRSDWRPPRPTSSPAPCHTRWRR